MDIGAMIGEITLFITYTDTGKNTVDVFLFFLQEYQNGNVIILLLP